MQIVELHGKSLQPFVLATCDFLLCEQHMILWLQHVAAVSPYVMNPQVREALYFGYLNASAS